MDWELIGLLSFAIAAGLIIVASGVLGYTRTEKVLGAVFFTTGAGFIWSISAFLDKSADFRGDADVDRWLAEMDRAVSVVDLFGWIAIAVAGAFLLTAIAHLWRERDKLRQSLQIELPRRAADSE